MLKLSKITNQLKGKKAKYFYFAFPILIIIYFVYEYFQEIENEQKRKIQAELDLKKRLVDEQIANSGGQNPDGSDRYDKNDPSGTLGVLKYTATGASFGASVGNLIVPGVGGVVGAAAGTVWGTYIGVYNENETVRNAVNIGISVPGSITDFATEQKNDAINTVTTAKNDAITWTRNKLGL